MTVNSSDRGCVFIFNRQQEEELIKKIDFNQEVLDSLENSNTVIFDQKLKRKPLQDLTNRLRNAKPVSSFASQKLSMNHNSPNMKKTSTLSSVLINRHSLA